MTSIITFDPPLGAVEHIHGGSPSHSQLLLGPQSLYIDFLFTALLSAYDYQNLVVRDGARLQVWTDIPRLEDEDGNEHGWREIEFVDPEALNRETSANTKVSLQVSGEKQQTQQPEELPFDTYTLYLAIAIPSAQAHEFSFTYRIVYPSGRTTWLGFYERNGAVIVHTDQDFSSPVSSRTIGYTENLTMEGNWSPDTSLPVTVFATNTEHADGLQIATVNDMATTRVWALGKPRLLRHASMLIIVPAPRIRSSQENFTHTLSYILSASPGATLSVSSKGGVTVSGSGTVHMTIVNCLRQHDPVTVVEAALKHSELSGNWTLVGNDIRSQTVVLACIGNGLPIPAVVVSFGSLQANFSQSPTSASVEISNFVTLFNSSVAGREVTEFALFSSPKSAMYVFNVEEEIAKPGHIILEVNSFHPKFTEAHTFSIAPLYRLHSQSRLGNAPKHLGRSWFAAILTSYRVVSQPKSDQPNTNSNPIVPASLGTITDPRGLLTPPPSPPLGLSVEAQNSSSTPFRLSKTSLRLSDIAEVSDGIIPVNYAVRKRPVARGAKVKSATTTTPHTGLRHLNVDTDVHAPSQKAPPRGHSPVDKPAVSSSKRAVPKPQRSSCLMWIFRIVFKCLFASVRMFLKVTFKIRITLAWGVGLVIRGPGFAWGLLWGAGARPVRLSMLSSMGSMNQSARETPHHQPKLSSSSDLPLSRSLSLGRNNNRVQTSTTRDSRYLSGRSSHSVDHSRITYREAMMNAEQPVSSRGSESSSYPNELETSGYNSEDISVSHAHESGVGGSVISNSDHVETTLGSIISQAKPPLLQPQSEQEDHHESDRGFYAEITPLHSNGTETVEIVLFTVASSGPRNSEKDAQPAYDITNAHAVDFEAVSLAKAINFLPGHHPHAEPAELPVAPKKNTHTPVDIRPLAVHITHLPDLSRPKPPDVLTAAYPSIRDLSASVWDQKNPGIARTLHEEAFNAQYASSGLVMCYQLPRETLDPEAGTVVVAVRSPEPVSRQT